MPCLVSTWVGDHLRVGKPFRYVTSHPGQLSLAILWWVGAMSTSLQAMGLRPYVTDCGVICLQAASRVQSCTNTNTDSGWPHNALRYH